MNTSTNIINIKTEILYRSAEDDFFYFNKINSAYKKLKEAVSLTPNHLKSIIMLADVSFLKGKIKNALSLYKQAEIINDNKLKVIASIANCYFNLKDYSSALLYCDKALNKYNTENYLLFSQIFELKINILMAQKNYVLAYKTWLTAEKIFNTPFIKANYNINYKVLNEKIILQKKLQKSNLKIV